MKKVMIVLFFLLSSQVSRCAVIHVPSDQSTIQEGIDAANDGDTVVVASGAYLENISISGKNIRLVSESGYEITSIEPASADSAIITVVGAVDTTCTIEGFSIRNCTSNNGITCLGTSPVILNCEVSYCVNGIYCTDSGARVYNCMVHHNLLKGIISGLGISPFTLRIIDNVIYSNGGCGIVSHADGEGTLIKRNLIRDHLTADGNPGVCGIHVATESGHSDVINNTIVGNNTGIYVMHRKSEDKTAYAWSHVYNNIISYNSRYGIYSVGKVAPGYIEFAYNDVWGNQVNGGGGMSLDPLFVDPENLDFTLQPGSPCIDAGDPDSIYNDPDGSRNDMGAFPFHLGPPALDINFGPDANADTVYVLTPTIFWSYTGETPQSHYHIQIGIDSLWDAAELWDTGFTMSMAGGSGRRRKWLSI